MRQQALLVATHNKGKLVELRELLADLPFTISDLGAFPAIKPIPETGHTFAENASLKARSYAKQLSLLTLADDSGLEVDVLNGGPGVRSARYGGERASDADRAHTLLAEISGVSSGARTARFVSVIAIADNTGELLSLSTGTCEGRIAETVKGSNGFGYDPIFIPNGFHQTFGELQPEVKNRMSHRARALCQALEFLRTLTGSPHAR